MREISSSDYRRFKFKYLAVDKITRIRSDTKAQTLRKATITAEQLQRRYDLVYRSLPGPNRVNPAAAARWYAAAGSATQSSIDEAEPLTWIKHLLDRRGRQSTTRLPWHLSALIFEEYVRSQIRPDMMETIPENQPIPPSTTHQSPSTPAKPYIVRSRPSSFLPSTPRISYDGHVSFEPYVESSRAMSEESRRSDDGYLRTWRNSLIGVSDSPHSSFSSPGAPSHPPRSDVDPSPIGSRLQIRDIASRMRRRPQGSDEGSSSARNSLSGDQSRLEDTTTKSRKTKYHSRPLDLALNLKLHKEHEPRIRSLPTSEADDDLDGIEVPMTVKAQHRALSEDEEPAAMFSESDVKTPGQPPLPTPRAAPPRHRPRLSLPARTLLNDDHSHHHHQHQHEADEEKEQHEYELKTQ